ncbi:MAG: dTMP kinase [Caldimicrobium sp.]|jgi:dTMP kinase
MFLSSPRKALFLFGLPRSGKTTLTEFLFDALSTQPLPFFLTGFITRELREAGERIGFDLIYLRDKTFKLPLARASSQLPKKSPGRPKVGKYTVFPENLEKMIELLGKDLLSRKNTLIFIDEIGKMESFSEKFTNFLYLLWEKNLKMVATLGKGEHPLLKEWRYKWEALYVEVTPENRDFLKDRLILEFIRKGKLIVIEGIDGAGKSTLFTILKERFSHKKNIVFSFEPTQGQYGKILRNFLKEAKGDQKTLLELFLKDRTEHVEKLILPSLKEGKTILLDRYYLSTIAYQGVHFRELPYLLLKNETIAPLPDLVIYLEIPINLALERIQKRNKDISLFEREDLLEKISEIYAKILPLFNYKIIKGDKPLEELYAEILALLKVFIPQI